MLLSEVGTDSQLKLLLFVVAILQLVLFLLFVLPFSILFAYGFNLAVRNFTSLFNDNSTIISGQSNGANEIVK